MKKPRRIRKIQRMQADLMRMASFNEFDGDAVANCLLKNRELWKSFLFTRDESLIHLRDMDMGHWNVDTLYVLINPGKEKELMDLTKSWNADEIELIENESTLSNLLGSFPPQNKILKVWWD